MGMSMQKGGGRATLSEINVTPMVDVMLVDSDNTAADKLIALLIDIVSKNGNLLLNVGPKPDGSISEIQLDRLHKLGEWLATNGEGIFDTRPWVRASPLGAKGPEVRFTHKGDSLYAFYLERPEGPQVTVPGVIAAEGTSVRVLGAGTETKWAQQGGDVVVETGRAPGPYAMGLRITPVPRVQA